ncbi:MAG: UvrD-helicase domain-containing protein [Tuberibacillus sp.]
MADQRFYNRPLGAKNKEVEPAKPAETLNSRLIVTDQDDDACYFRALEEKGLFLNKPQIEAVRHFQGPLLTLAGAGSGKTSVLVSRTGYLIRHHQVQPRQILLVTFSTKAAGEMRERIAELPGLSAQEAQTIEARTFHSFFLMVLRVTGYHQDILSNERYKQIIIKRLLKEMNLADRYQLETLLSLFSVHKMNMEKLPEKTAGDKEIAKVFRGYEEWKKVNNKLDFDDILVEAYHLLQQSPALLQNLQNRYQYIMVDEFQDTNLLQYELIKMIASAHGNLCVVGDDDQTIYSFNGARNEFILNFNKTFPQAKTVTLDINYRSTDAIIGLGNAVIQKNEHRKPKTLQAVKKSDEKPQFGRPSTSDEEAEWIVQSIKDKVAAGTLHHRDFAILHRTQSGSRAIFEQLSLAEIPFISYSMGDQVFYEHWTVKPIVDHLRLALNPRYFNAIEEILPSMYINREKGFAFIKAEDEKRPKKYPLIYLSEFPGIKSFQVKQIKERIKIIKEIKALPPVSAIKVLRSRFYDKFLEASDRENATDHKESIIEMLDELEASAKRFDTVLSFISFVDDMIQRHYEMKEMKKDQNRDAVSLMTIHRAKGLEFPVVYLIGASENILPHQTALEAGKKTAGAEEQAKAALEEERRLAYVAITRAMDELYITSPAIYRGDKVGVSPFLLEAFGAEGQTSPVKGETVRAWVCTSDTCNGWQRLAAAEDYKIKEKPCPICHGKMKQGRKAV